MSTNSIIQMYLTDKHRPLQCVDVLWSADRMIAVNKAHKDVRLIHWCIPMTLIYLISNTHCVVCVGVKYCHMRSCDKNKSPQRRITSRRKKVPCPREYKGGNAVSFCKGKSTFFFSFFFKSRIETSPLTP